MELQITVEVRQEKAFFRGPHIRRFMHASFRGAI